MFQEAPERESLIFQWFEKVWMGGAMDVRARAMAAGSGPDPQNLKTNQTPLELALAWAAWCLASHQYRGLGYLVSGL